MSQTMSAYAYIPETLAHLAVPLESLCPYPGNARRGNVAALADSLRQHGQYRAIVVNTRSIGGTSNVILAGNHTWLGMCELRDNPPKHKGGKPAPRASHIAVTFVDVDADTAARINLIDNRLGDQSDYDPAALLSQLKALPGLDGTGYAQPDLDALMGQLDTSAVEWPQIKPKTTHVITVRYTDDDEPAILEWLGLPELPSAANIGREVLERIRAG